MTAINPVLAFIIITLACGALLVRLSPRCLREIACWCKATADAHDARQDIYHRKMSQYRDELGLPTKPVVLKLRKGIISGREVL